MIIYKNTCTDPYFNLAAEQYMMEAYKDNEDIFMLWRNEPSVIIGKNQNAYAEINGDFVRENSIKVVRRLTGGGAVFHDLGNVNFSFIVPAAENTEIDFRRFTEPIIKALGSLGVKAELSGRNDILIEGMKVSGNAQCVYSGKTMHHGTLLFSADISDIAGSLNVNREKMESKGIKSVRSRVGNISSYIDQKLNVEQFIDCIENFISKEYGAVKRCLSEEDITKIKHLADEKYSRWEWNFGESKQYAFVNKKRFPFGTVEINCDTENGIIKKISVTGDFFGTSDVSVLGERLTGKRYLKEDILPCLSDIGDFIHGASSEDIAELLLKQN
ncbi:MAG: lipoate--protein ligase [Ruminococcaceae bacterium]|nr:lipoate--protein ligase [Oscillospiraceae bacterium]